MYRDCLEIWRGKVEKFIYKKPALQLQSRFLAKWIRLCLLLQHVKDFLLGLFDADAAEERHAVDVGLAEVFLDAHGRDAWMAMAPNSSSTSP